MTYIVGTYNIMAKKDLKSAVEAELLKKIVKADIRELTALFRIILEHEAVAKQSDTNNNLKTILENIKELNK